MEEAICGPWLTPLPTKRWSSLRENLCYLGKLYIGHQTTQKPRKYMALFLVLIQKLYMSFWIRDLKSLALIFPLPCLVFQQKWHWFSQFLEQESLKLKKKKVHCTALENEFFTEYEIFRLLSCLRQEGENKTYLWRLDLGCKCTA